MHRAPTFRRTLARAAFFGLLVPISGALLGLGIVVLAFRLIGRLP